jgi:hypothetical protein
LDQDVCGGCGNQCPAGDDCEYGSWLWPDGCPPDDPLCGCCRSLGHACTHTDQCCPSGFPNFAFECHRDYHFCRTCVIPGESCGNGYPCCDGPDGERRRCDRETFTCVDA